MRGHQSYPRHKASHQKGSSPFIRVMCCRHYLACERPQRAKSVHIYKSEITFTVCVYDVLLVCGGETNKSSQTANHKKSGQQNGRISLSKKIPQQQNMAVNIIKLFISSQCSHNNKTQKVFSLPPPIFSSRRGRESE